MGKYESITKYLELLENDSYGEWISDVDDDGDEYSYVDYSDNVVAFMEDLFAFDEEHPELRLTRYMIFLRQNGIEPEADSMSAADVSNLDERCVLSLIMGAARTEMFADGAFMQFLENGCLIRWLKRLKEFE